MPIIFSKSLHIEGNDHDSGNEPSATHLSFSSTRQYTEKPVMRASLCTCSSNIRRKVKIIHSETLITQKSDLNILLMHM